MSKKLAGILRYLQWAVVALSFAVSSAFAFDINAPKEDKPLIEAKIISLFQNGERSARVVIQPCAKVNQCLRQTVYIDTNTHILDNGAEISLYKARQLKWKYAVIVMGDRGTIEMINRVPRLYSM